MKSVALSRYAVGFKRTLDHLRAWPIKLPSQIKETTIRLHTNNKGHSGLRVFMYQHLPQMKYHNPDVNFKIVRNDTPPQCAIEFADKTGQLIKRLNVQHNEPNDIRKEIEMTVSENNNS